MASIFVKLATTTRFLDTFLQKRFDAENYIVEKARTGPALLEMAKNKKSNLVIAQTDLPEMDGFQICAELKNAPETRDIPVILLGAPADEIRALEAGANGFLKMPFDETALMDAVQKLLRLKKTVLLVDDSRVIHTRTGGDLRANGFLVLDAYDGAEGIEIARREKPDLIISDIEMPKMDGYAMCREIKRNETTAHIPVIMVSSLDKGIEIEKGFDVGANDYLVKPVVYAELQSCMNTWLRTMEIRRRETILVVDDSETVVNMLQFGLKQQGFNVIACSDGEDAYEQAVQKIPDAIVADMDMPRLNGAQLIKYLRERPETRQIPVVIISSRESRSEAARILKVGAASFVTKPFTIDKIVANVERLTAEQRYQNEREAMKLFMSEAAQEFVSDISQSGAAGEYHAVEKQLTFLFSDIVGFTTLCEQLKPVDLVKTLNSYLDAMTTVLKNNGAIIDKFIGDAIVAIFSGVTSAGNPCYRAVKAASEMLKQQKEFNESCGAGLRTRIGINSGRAIFGEIGSKLYRRDFTVIGDAVNTAQRLQSNTEPDSILISDAVYANVKDMIAVEEKGFLSVKGKKIDVKCYRVVDVPEIKPEN